MFDLKADQEELHDLAEMEQSLRERLDPKAVDADARAAQAALIERHGGPDKARNVGAPDTTPVPGYGQE